MAQRAVSFRISEGLYTQIRQLRTHVARTADVPIDPHDVTTSDVMRRALYVGVLQMLNDARDHGR